MSDFLYLSRYAGMREDLVQAGGGNSSVKISPTQMLIKASGCQLADLTENSGWCAVNPAVLKACFSADFTDFSQEAEKRILSECLIPSSACARADGIEARPSIETFLHSITRKYTLHTHPTVMNMLAATESGWQSLRSLFPDALFVDYATPGIKLAAAYFSAFKAYGGEPNVIFLKNHGLVVSGETADFVKDRTEAVLRAIEAQLGIDMERYHAATEVYDILRTVPKLNGNIVWLSQHCDVRAGSAAFGARLWDWQFCPDCLVYCGKKPLVLQEGFLAADFANHLSRYGTPVIVSYKGSVYILSGSVKKAKDTESVLAFSAQVALANQNAKLNLLSEGEQNFLLDWDAEKYRQNMK